MNTHTLAAAVIGFLLGGLTVSIAADSRTTVTSHPPTARAALRTTDPQNRAQPDGERRRCIPAITWVAVG